MSAKQQTGSVTFGSVIVGTFSVQDGFTYDGKSVEAIECTVDTDVTTTFVPSDLPTFGQFTGTIYTPSTLDLDGVVGTTEALTWTWPTGSDSTPKSITGNAFLMSGSTTGTKDDLIKSAVVFKWTGAAVTTVAT
jgi:hypothetical protein